MSAEREERIACCQCGEEDSKIGYYNEDEVRYWFVECSDCGYRTSDCEDVDAVIDEWNGVEEEEEDEDESETIATLVRMLAEKEQEIKELRRPKTSTDLIANLAAEETMGEIAHSVAVSNLKDINLVGKDVIPNLEKEVKELKRALQNEKNRADRLEEADARLSKVLKAALDRSYEGKKKIKDWEHSMFLIDTALVSMELSRQYEDTITPIMSIQELLDGIRQKRDWPPDTNTRTFDDALGEIIWISSPYGPSPSPGVYLRAIQAQLTSHPTQDDMVTAVYGLAMERFGQGSRGYTLAWEALGRPGETQHDGRRPRT